MSPLFVNKNASSIFIRFLVSLSDPFARFSFIFYLFILLFTYLFIFLSLGTVMNLKKKKNHSFARGFSEKFGRSRSIGNQSRSVGTWTKFILFFFFFLYTFQIRTGWSLFETKLHRDSMNSSDSKPPTSPISGVQHTKGFSANYFRHFQSYICIILFLFYFSFIFVSSNHRDYYQYYHRRSRPRCHYHHRHRLLMLLPVFILN